MENGHCIHFHYSWPVIGPDIVNTVQSAPIFRTSDFFSIPNRTWCITENQLTPNVLCQIREVGYEKSTVNGRTTGTKYFMNGYKSDYNFVALYCKRSVVGLLLMVWCGMVTCVCVYENRNPFELLSSFMFQMATMGEWFWVLLLCFFFGLILLIFLWLPHNRLTFEKYLAEIANRSWKIWNKKLKSCLKFVENVRNNFQFSVHQMCCAVRCGPGGTIFRQHHRGGKGTEWARK